MKTDLLVIGGGPAGYATAIRAVKNGLNTVLVEKDYLGGTCLNIGCMPTKTLVYASEEYSKLKELTDYGITVDNPKLDFTRLMAKKDEVVAKLRAGVTLQVNNSGVTFINGIASFINEHTISVGKEIIEATNIIIATGSSNRNLHFNSSGILDSTSILNLKNVPQNLVIIGGGVIGIEFAGIFNNLGSNVTVIEMMDDILPTFDKDLVKRLRVILKRRGINFIFKDGVRDITHENRYRLMLDSDKEIFSDEVLVSVGRTCNVTGFNLHNTCINYSNKGIEVNEFYQTNIPNIYAIGDVTGQIMLAHMATAQGQVALNHILNKTSKVNLSLVPSIVYTNPPLAMIGQGREELDRLGIEYKVYKSLFAGNGRAITMNQTDGYCQILVGNDGKILGCQILGIDADTLIHEISALMNKGGTYGDLKNMIHAHPTLNEIFG